jgi:hypothetical protein
MMNGKRLDILQMIMTDDVTPEEQSQRLPRPVHLPTHKRRQALCAVPAPSGGPGRYVRVRREICLSGPNKPTPKLYARQPEPPIMDRRLLPLPRRGKPMTLEEHAMTSKMSLRIAIKEARSRPPAPGPQPSSKRSNGRVSNGRVSNGDEAARKRRRVLPPLAQLRSPTVADKKLLKGAGRGLALQQPPQLHIKGLDILEDQQRGHGEADGHIIGGFPLGMQGALELEAQQRLVAGSSKERCNSILAGPVPKRALALRRAGALFLRHLCEEERLDYDAESAALVLFDRAYYSMEVADPPPITSPPPPPPQQQQADDAGAGATGGHDSSYCECDAASGGCCEDGDDDVLRDPYTRWSVKARVYLCVQLVRSTHMVAHWHWLEPLEK